jgi:hypothetical protein
MDTRARVRRYLERKNLSPTQFAASCNPPITGQSVRMYLRGAHVGAKVARALASRVPGVTVGKVLES